MSIERKRTVRVPEIYRSGKGHVTDLAVQVTEK